jgi:hypothetical protein
MAPLELILILIVRCGTADGERNVALVIVEVPHTAITWPGRSTCLSSNTTAAGDRRHGRLRYLVLVFGLVPVADA